MAHHGIEADGGLGDLERGTDQRAELRTRLADIAWTALCVLLALWGVWTAVGAVRGAAAWVWCAVAWVLFAGALALRTAAVRRRPVSPVRPAGSDDRPGT